MDSGFAVSAPVALLTPRQVAAYLQCSTSALYSRSWRRRNRIPEPVKIGRLARWRLQDLEARASEKGAA
jgi:predicted DNA-binding transcriptional regulator AlpA